MNQLTKQDVFEKILNELGYFNFKRNSMSFQYLIDAIFLVIIDKKTIKDFNYYLYPKIAKKYDTKPENVLWNISKLIKMMYLNTSDDTVREYFNLKYSDNPSTKAFIIQISYKVKTKYYKLY